MGLICTKCGTAKLEDEFYRDSSRPTGRTSQCKSCRDGWEKNRRKVALQHYSGSEDPYCACCFEDTYAFLSLDHMDGGGGQQRKKLGGGGFWTWLVREGYPDGFQVLCHNCNLGRQVNGGICPHNEA